MDCTCLSVCLSVSVSNSGAEISRKQHKTDFMATSVTSFCWSTALLSGRCTDLTGRLIDTMLLYTT